MSQWHVAGKRLRCRLLFMIPALLAACDSGDGLYAVGTLERDRVELSADSSEPVSTVHVTEGERVRAGDVLVSQEAAVAGARLEQARAARDEAEARLEQAVAGPRSEAIARARARLDAADSAVETAQHELRRERALADSHFASQSRLDVLEGRYEEALALRREARAALEELEAGTRQEELRQARQALAAAEARVRELGVALDRTRLLAPMDAVVEAVPVEPGERPAPGDPVVVLRALTPTYARVQLPEPLRARLRSGAPAVVTLDGRADPLAGEVRWIATEAAFTPYYALTQRDRSRLSYAAEVLLTDPSADDLPVGVPVEVRFPAAHE